MSRLTIALLYTAPLWLQKDAAHWWNMLSRDGHYNNTPDPVGYWWWWWGEIYDHLIFFKIII